MVNPVQYLPDSYEAFLTQQPLLQFDTNLDNGANWCATATELREWRRDDWNPDLLLDEKMNVDVHALGGRSLRLLATDMENTKEQSMKLQDWELTIQQMIEESNHEPKESGKSRVLMEWRAKLARKPHLLQPYQIDEIVREVRRRLTSVSLQPSSGSPARLTSVASTGLL